MTNDVSLKKRKRFVNKSIEKKDFKNKKVREPRLQSAEVWSKSKKKRMRHIKAKIKQKEIQMKDGTVINQLRTEECLGKRAIFEKTDSVKAESEISIVTPASALQKSFKARLTGSRFRSLNEELYTSTSKTAFKRFSENPDLYEQYHDGFRHQVEQWPVNPINVIVSSLKTLAKISSPKKPLVVADFGCGDAQIAKELLETGQESDCSFLVHSFDFVACNNLVTACDMANVPLANETVDVGVFCLSLMGTNLADFIREAHRVLKRKGALKIAEVRSRFESRSGIDELDGFLKILARLGFDCVKKDLSNKMFLLLDLQKINKAPDVGVTFTAKPCIYKRR